MAGAGSDRKVTLFNCFVMGAIADDMTGIFDALKEAALTMQQGGGIGHDFSTLRPRGAPVHWASARTPRARSRSCDVWDAMCRTIMSAGHAPRRHDGHFALRPSGYRSLYRRQARRPAELRMFNLSVLITDAFMDAVQRDDADWDLKFGGTVHGARFRARDRCGTGSCARPTPMPNPAWCSSTASTSCNNLSYMRGDSRPPTPAANSHCRPMAPACSVRSIYRAS